jgi:hypothetical protein
VSLGEIVRQVPDAPYGYGQVGREFRLRPFSAGSILTLRNRIEPLASTTSVERTLRKMQFNKTLSVDNCARENWVLTTEDTEEDIRKQTKPAERATADRYRTTCGSKRVSEPRAVATGS